MAIFNSYVNVYQRVFNHTVGFSQIGSVSGHVSFENFSLYHHFDPNPDIWVCSKMHGTPFYPMRVAIYIYNDDKNNNNNNDNT